MEFTCTPSRRKGDTGSTLIRLLKEEKGEKEERPAFFLEREGEGGGTNFYEHFEGEGNQLTNHLGRSVFSLKGKGGVSGINGLKKKEALHVEEKRRKEKNLSWRGKKRDHLIYRKKGRERGRKRKSESGRERGGGGRAKSSIRNGRKRKLGKNHRPLSIGGKKREKKHRCRKMRKERRTGKGGCQFSRKKEKGEWVRRRREKLLEPQLSSQKRESVPERGKGAFHY